MKPKIIAAYLPQYHETDENNKFWGKGYTDWVAVKDAKAVKSFQTQPKVPLDNNYYDLSTERGKRGKKRNKNQENRIKQKNYKMT